MDIQDSWQDLVSGIAENYILLIKPFTLLGGALRDGLSQHWLLRKSGQARP
ncbi:MAG: hypothetical protein F6K63_23070 [Moorea sp. SIO1G6]|uniref:hypothetical protein n=1 Tax=unclassified Moorena TaxID=2683338 RepID=UPI0013BCE946|nr:MULTISPECIES: hypothetical protein [unclassified Moorena]NEP51054.1 hypothetical protein [Moorena sp. SIO3C2]NEQ11061.1 hypothetical protein [Moorena sp. SIO4E2]NET67107.1 hypothetical protein [Moorena sp. SIO1G6]